MRYQYSLTRNTAIHYGESVKCLFFFPRTGKIDGLQPGLWCDGHGHPGAVRRVREAQVRRRPLRQVRPLSRHR